MRATLTVDEAAALCGVSRGTAYEAIRRGDLPHLRLGRRIVVPRARLLALLGETTPETTEADPAIGPAPITPATDITAKDLANDDTK